MVAICILPPWSLPSCRETLRDRARGPLLAAGGVLASDRLAAAWRRPSAHDGAAHGDRIRRPYRVRPIRVRRPDGRRGVGSAPVLPAREAWPRDPGMGRDLGLADVVRIEGGVARGRPRDRCARTDRAAGVRYMDGTDLPHV